MPRPPISPIPPLTPPPASPPPWARQQRPVGLPPRLHRSSEQVLGGVCGGLAATFGWNVNAVQALVLLLSLLTFPAVPIVYAALWAVLPEDGPC